ncbi:hypothetical protein L6R29_08775 [Myxococcota bacterium]|nr:hypothetical protein [Myxococcota bacterium]
MTQMRDRQRLALLQKPFAGWVLALFVVASSVATLGCKGSTAPQVGVFPIKVVALTSDKVGIPKAKVSINNTMLGETDQFGTFVGTYRGKVQDKIRIKVEGAGQDNYMIMTSRLRLRKTAHGLAPAEIKVEAFLRQPPPDAETSPNPPPNPPPADPNATGNASNATASNTGSNQATVPSKGPDPTPERPPPPAEERGTDSPPIRTPRPVGPETPPKPRISGKYRIKVIANVSGIQVLKGKKPQGVIRIPEGIVSVKHVDKSESPQPVTITLKARKPWLYKTPEVTRDVALNVSQEEYEIRVDFEKAPPFKIMARANIPGIRVSMGKDKQEIADPNNPVAFEYTGKPKTLTLVFVPADRKVKPRRITKKVQLEAGKFEYTADTAEFKAPEPAAAPRDPEPPARDREPAVAVRDREPAAATRDPEPPARDRDPAVAVRDREPAARDSEPVVPVLTREPAKTFSGKFAITVTSTAKGAVYKNGRKVGSISSDGGSYVVKHTDKSSSPKPITIKVRAAKADAFKKRDVEQEVALEAGRETYTSEIQFEKRPGIVIKAYANQKGTRISLKGKPQGEIVEPEKPLSIDYDGSPRGSLTVLFVPPGNSFKPRKVTKTVRLQSGVFEYEVRAEFSEVDTGSEVTLKPNCFRRSKGKKRVVVLKASAGTAFSLKSSEGVDCEGESLSKTGKAGLIKVQMPAGFVRVIAQFPDGAKSEKTFEVADGGGNMTVSFSQGGKRCNLDRIQAKIRNSIFLEEEEVACLRNVQKSNSQYFSAHTSLSRFYCHKRAYKNGISVLDELYKDPRNRFQPYPAMSLGIEYSRCKSYDRSLDLLRQAERTANRFAAADKYVNQKSLYKALAEVYERRYYSKKNITDLRRSLKSFERLGDILRGDDDDKSYAQKNITRLKSLLSKRGGLEE